MRLVKLLTEALMPGLVCVGCATHALPQDAVASELLKRYGGESAPTVLAADACTQPRELDLPTAPAELAARFPGGVYVLCDLTTADGAATGTVLRYAFHASRNEVLPAQKVEAGFSVRSGRWRVTKWRALNLDYF